MYFLEIEIKVNKTLQVLMNHYGMKKEAFRILKNTCERNARITEYKKAIDYIATLIEREKQKKDNVDVISTLYLLELELKGLA